MLRNDLVIAIRTIKKFKFYSIIKILSLALAIACCLVVFLFVRYELSFDEFHKNADRILRLEMTMKLPIGEKPYSIVRSDLVPALKDEFPEVEDAVRMDDRTIVVNYRENRFQVTAEYADPGFFETFTFPLLKGDPKTVLQEPYSVVLAEDLAKKLMPGEDFVGKVIRIDNKMDFQVTGLMKDFPENSHIQAGLIASYSSLQGMTGTDFTLVNMYLLFKNRNEADSLMDLFPSFYKKHFGEKRAEKDKFFLRPLTDIYLHSNPIFDLGKKSQMKYSYYLAFLGFFILFLAVINYMNLTTANAFRRVKEVAVRKVIGADRTKIIWQFLIESMVLTFIATAAAVFLVEFILPFFNRISDRRLEMDLAGDPGLYFGLFGIILLTGLASGIYPAFLLSSLPTADTIKGKIANRLGNLKLRQMLVIFQFSICIFFIIGTTVAVRQLSYVMHKDLGFPKENVLIMSVYRMKTQAEAFRNELLANPDIKSVSLEGIIPSEDFNWTSLVQPEGFTEAFKIPVFQVDPYYFETLGIPLAEGRGFFKDSSADIGLSAIINQQAVKKFGWNSALGRRLNLPDDEGKIVTVVGMVRDFHLESLHKEIAPYVFVCAAGQPSQATIRVNSDRLSRTIAFIKSKWLEFAPHDIFQIEFLDDQIARMYKEDERTQKILLFASILAILIACLGLFGLAAYSAESRTKEIGIRKVLGSSASSLVMLIGREFSIWVLAANLIAWPVAYYFMKRWLQNFAYRISIGIGIFIISGLLALAIAILTVSYQSIKAALANPVESLRYE
jgi:putative ABC transport system permease protein